MLKTRTRIATDRDLSGVAQGAADDFLMDAATAGANTALEHTPSGASNVLRMSQFGPEREADGSVVWGYSSAYARFVEEGTRPHWIPLRAMPDLRKWARRVLGDEEAAWAVRQKIAERGTKGQGFVEKGVDAMRAFAMSHSLGDYLEDRL